MKIIVPDGQLYNARIEDDDGNDIGKTLKVTGIKIVMNVSTGYEARAVLTCAMPDIFFQTENWSIEVKDE